jgi:hypothetical protein
MKMLIFLTLFFAPLFGFAQTGSLFSYEGILTDAAGTPINTSQSVTFQVLYGGSCVTFEETQSVTPGANGEFSVIIGAGVRTDSTGNTIAKIFGSSGTVACQTGGPQSLSGFAVRQLHVKVGSTDLLPDVVIGNVPFSWNAQKLADKSATDFIQVDGTNNITQTNVASIFSRYSTLNDLLNGNFSNTPAGAIDRAKITSGTANHVVINASGGALSSEAQLAISRGGTGTNAVPTNGQILIGNGTGYAAANITAGAGVSVVNSAGGITISTSGVGSVTSITAGTGLTGGGTPGGTITSAGTIGLGAELTGLNSLSATGLVQRTGTGTYSTIGGVTAAEVGFLAGTTSIIQTQINGALKISSLPATSCAAGEALTWQSPTNTLICFALTIASGNVSGLTAAIDARIAVDGTKLPIAGGTMTGNINMGNFQLSNVGYLHLQNKTFDAGMSAGNNGFVWYNSIDRAVKYYDGISNRTIAGYTGTCADSEVLKWNSATQNWICATDAGAGGGADATQIRGVNVSATAPTTGQFLQIVSGNWTPTSMPICNPDEVLIFTAGGTASCSPISGLTNNAISGVAAIARTKLANGTPSHVLVNDAAGVMTSEAQLSFTRGGTGPTTYTDGQLLIGNSVGNTLAKANLTAGSGVSITNGNGTITIAATGSGGTVTSVSSSNSDIGVATGTTTPVLTLNSGVAGGVGDANKIAKLSGTGLLVDAMIPNLDTAKITTGTLPIARGGTNSGTALNNKRVMVSTGGAIVEAAVITANRALISDGNGLPTQSAVTGTELGYVSGVTGAIQTQLDALTAGGVGKVSKAGDSMTGDLTLNAQREIHFADLDSSNYVGLRSPANVSTNKVWTLPASDGTTDQVLKTDGAGNLGWTTAASGTGDFKADGTVAMTDQLRNVTGTAGLPGMSFAGDTNTGIFAAGADTLAISTGGTQRLTVTSTGSIGIGTNSPGALLDVKGAIRMSGSTSGYTGFQPAAAAGSTIWTLPAADGSANQVLKTDGAGALSWVTPLTSVNSASIADGSIVDADVNASAAIARSKIAGSAANAVVINDGSGMMSTQAQLGVPLGGTGASSFNANGIVMSGVTGSSALAAINCAAVGRMLEWTGTTWGCSADFVTSGTPGSKVNYVLLSGGISASGVTVSAAGSNATVDLNLLAKGSGSVRVGSPLAVDYETVSKTFRTIASGSTAGNSINFANGNLQYTTADCGPMTLSGMFDGATYVLAVKGTTAATCSFTASGLTIKLPPDHGPTEPGKSTLYTFMVMGTDVYVSWVTGY